MKATLLGSVCLTQFAWLSLLGIGALARAESLASGNPVIKKNDGLKGLKI